MRPAGHRLNTGRAIALLLAQPSLIKRPVLVQAGRVEVGFSEAAYQALFAH